MLSERASWHPMSLFEPEQCGRTSGMPRRVKSRRGICGGRVAESSSPGEYIGAIFSQEGIPLMLDPAPARAVPADLLEQVTWFTPNESEAAFFIGEAAMPVSGSEAIAKELLSRGPRNVVLKVGARGGYLATAEGVDSAISPFAVRAVDATARRGLLQRSLREGPLRGTQFCYQRRFAAAPAAIAATRAGA